jgi:FecR protein
MNRLSYAIISVSVLIALSGTVALAQSVISARSGLIHYVEGRALLDGKPVEVKITSFPEVKENMELRTEDGRAEVLLNPGVFLRLAENSSIRMISNKLSDSRVEFLSGSAIIEASSDLLQKENSVTVVYKDSSAHLRKSGIYRFDSDPAQFRVYSGEAEVENDSNVLIVKAGRMVSFDGLVAVEKFNPKEGDALSRWSQRRAEYISMANVSAAKYVSESGNTWNSSGWYYNPYFGMFTFIPMSGVFYNPYGFRYYSPGVVYRVYQAPTAYVGRSGFGSGSGYSTPAATPTPTSSGVTSAAPASVRGASPGVFGGSGASLGRAGGSGGGRAVR